MQTFTPGLSRLTARICIPAESTLTKPLPVAKVVIHGNIGDESLTSQVSKPRAIIFVIDRSGSMCGSRINQIKEALKNFIPTIIGDESCSLHVVLFSGTASSFTLDKNLDQALRQIDQIVATGGTNFAAASAELVKLSHDLVKREPTKEITVIMCSDGEVDRTNAVHAHDTWKQFVTREYRSVHTLNPFVCAIGIARGHSADILDGFIVSDETGNYLIGETASEIHDAFSNACQEAVSRSAIKLQFTFSVGVYRDIYCNDICEIQEAICVSSDVEQVFWVNLRDVVANDDGGFRVLCNRQDVRVEVCQIDDLYEGRCIEIDYYLHILLGMLAALRSTTDPLALRTRATEIETELKELEKIFEKIHKPAAYAELSRILDVPPSEITDAIRAERYELMKRYREISRISRDLRKYASNLTRTCSSLKDLVSEIIFGNVRLQEIRQHILNLHFRKKHAKRMNKLILTEEQLRERQETYDGIAMLDEKDVEDITDAMGSGCCLSTLSMRDLAMDSNPLFIVGRVRRTGGLAVSNPEMICIEYISPDCVSNTFFEMAVDVSESDTFVDGSRQEINARLFPLYGNEKHMECTKPFLSEALSHSVSGRTDIAVADYSGLWAVVGKMIASEKPTNANVKRLFERVLPSFHLLCANAQTNPFKADGRQRDRSLPEVTLCELSAERVRRYISNAKFRTTGMVSNVQVLFADVMLAFVDGNREFVDQVIGNKAFWWGAVLQRLRSVLGSQLTQQGSETERRRAEANQDAVFEIIVRGLGPDKEARVAIDEANELFDLRRRPFVWTDLFGVDECQNVTREEATEWDAMTLTRSQLRLCADVMSRIEVQDLIQAHRFMRTLKDLGDDMKDNAMNDSHYERFKCVAVDEESKENDLVAFIREIHGTDDPVVDFVFVRALCAVAVLTCANNKKYERRLELIEKMMNDLDEAYWVLEELHANFIIPMLSKKYYWPEEENHWRKFLVKRGKLDVWTGTEWAKATIVDKDDDEDTIKIRFDMYGKDDSQDIWLNKMETTRIAPVYTHVEKDSDDEPEFDYWNDEIRRRVEEYKAHGWYLHRYRESNIPNRHGHCNSNPYLGRRS